MFIAKTTNEIIAADLSCCLMLQVYCTGEAEHISKRIKCKRYKIHIHTLTHKLVSIKNTKLLEENINAETKNREKKHM